MRKERSAISRQQAAFSRMKSLHVSARSAALAGIVGPLVLGGMIGVLTVLQYQFMIGLRWHPLRAPTTDWPSGLALGPYGWLMVATFVVSGLLLMYFALGLHQAVHKTTRSGPALLMIAGVALAGFVLGRSTSR